LLSFYAERVGGIIGVFKTRILWRLAWDSFRALSPESWQRIVSPSQLQADHRRILACGKATLSGDSPANCHVQRTRGAHAMEYGHKYSVPADRFNHKHPPSPALPSLFHGYFRSCDKAATICDGDPCPIAGHTQGIAFCRQKGRSLRQPVQCDPLAAPRVCSGIVPTPATWPILRPYSPVECGVGCGSASRLLTTYWCDSKMCGYGVRRACRRLVNWHQDAAADPCARHLRSRARRAAWVAGNEHD
jgi:hypothetical protein